MNKKTCTFCGRDIDEVEQLINVDGGDINICDDCIKECYEIVKNNSSNKSVNGMIKPKEILKELNKRVIGQDDAKKTLSVAIYNHQKRNFQNEDEIKIEKSNILLVGPTGSGKTLLAKSLAEILNVPILISDATPLTEAGYVGKDVESLLVGLYFESGEDIKKAENGIIYIDEIDKLATIKDSMIDQKDVSGVGVQQALLKIMEGSLVDITIDKGRNVPKEKITIDTSNILFICAGAFSGIEEIINKRNDKKAPIGFNQDKLEEDHNKSVNILEEDILNYGLTPEFLGRLPILTKLNKLTEKELVDILTKPTNALIPQYQKLFEMDGVKLTVLDDALKEIAKEALKRQTSARALRSIVEDILKEAMFEAAYEENGTEYIITKNSIKLKKVTKKSVNKELCAKECTN